MNLTGVSYWSPEFPFIDRMRMAGEWMLGNRAAATDAKGNPVIAADVRDGYIIVPVDPVSVGTSTTYVVTYKGTGTVAVAGGTVISSKPGEVVVRIETSVQEQVVFLRDLTSSDPIRDMHVVRQDQVGLFNQGELFNPAFLDKVTPFSTLRFMDWGHTNGSLIDDWSDRPTTERQNWGNVPLETMVALSNKTNNDMWLNIPAHADDDYVRRTMEYVRDNLKPGLKVHLEYSNEVWNWMFEQTHYAADKANQLFGRDANGDGRIDPNDAAENVEGAAFVYYGYRAAQVASIARDVFGDASGTRLLDVLGTQTRFYGVADYIVRGVARAGLGNVGDLFDEWAITTYFGGHMSGVTANDRQTILGWAHGGEAGLTAAFNAIATGAGLEEDDSLRRMAADAAYHGKLAASMGLDLVAYEGGFGSWADKFAPEDQPLVMAFVDKLRADPRMGDMYQLMIGGFAAGGGSTLMAFNMAQKNHVTGSWTTVPNIYSSSPAYEALISGNSDTTDIVTPLGSYVLGGRAATLTYTGGTTFVGTGNALDNVIRGGPGANTLLGRAGNDTLYGGAGNDLLDGGTGADKMYGGRGDDVFIVDDARDEVFDHAVDGGVDEVRTSLSSYTLKRVIENLTYTGTGNFEGKGNKENNVLTGGAGDDRLIGYAGNDTLIGGAGNDILNGGPGADRMIGGMGDDSYVVDDAGDVVVEYENQGYDIVRVQINAYTMSANVEEMIFRGTGNFVGTGNATANRILGGTGNDRLFGLAGNDVLIGKEGNDYLDGGAGADRMEGGVGDDVYLVDDVGDVVVELAGGGRDEVRTGLSEYALPQNVEDLTFIGVGRFTGRGNDLNNRIVAGNGGSSLFGGAGNDVLIGGAGVDQLDGGVGADRMEGGGGDDVYFVDDENDVVVELANAGGQDQVRTTLSRYTLGIEVEYLTFVGTGAFVGTGNEANNRIVGGGGDDRLLGLAGNDVLIGGAGNDYLDGGTGGDRMEGGAGDDVYIVDSYEDSVFEEVGQGIDEVRTALANYTLSGNVENLIYTGSAAFYGAGNALDNVIRGAASAGNSLVGGAGNDRLYGGSGNDYLEGGSGADLMDGGLGDDTYVVDDAGDVIVDAGGTDIVESYVSYTLLPFLEHLRMGGSAAIDATGNDLSNNISGNAGNNVLRGMGGDDLINGGAGDDLIDGGDGVDNLSGGDGNDVILGGAGNDYLFGNAGDDVLVGGAGADTLLGGTGADTFRFAPGDLGRTEATSDVIWDYQVGVDRLDFAAFDANPATAAHDAFRFVGSSAFSGQAGEIRSTWSAGGGWLIQGDADGDRVADFVLKVSGDQASPLTTADFVF